MLYLCCSCSPFSCYLSCSCGCCLFYLSSFYVVVVVVPIVVVGGVLLLCCCCCYYQKGRKGAGVKGAGVANCRIFRSAVPSVVVWSILLVSLSGVKKKLWQFMTRAPLPPAPFADSWYYKGCFCCYCCCCNCCVIAVAVIVVFCCSYALCLLWCFYVVMLVRKLEAGGKTKTGGPISGTTSGRNPPKSRGQLCFQMWKLCCFCFFCFLMCVCVFLQKHCKNRVSADFCHCLFGLVGAKNRVYNWATAGLIAGPHVGSYFLRHMWPKNRPKNFVKKMFFWSFIFQKKLILPAEKRWKNKTKKGGPVIDPTKGHKWPRYKPYNIYIYMLWSYYLVQVWPFGGLLSGPRWGHYLVQVCLRTIKIGVSSDFSLNYHFVFFCVPNYLAIF